MISITSRRRRLRLIAAALLLYFVAANPAIARVAMYQPKPIAELQLMTASELTIEAMQACDGAVGSRLMADHQAAIQLGKRSVYLTESQEHRDYLATVLRVLRANLGREPLWMVEFRQAALGRDPKACSRAHEHSLAERQSAPR
jgi:hypothetical protein